MKTGDDAIDTATVRLNTAKYSKLLHWELAGTAISVRVADVKAQVLEV